MTSAQRSQPTLTVVEWGALDLSGPDPVIEGAIAEPSSIPAGLRRRLGLFEKSVVQAVLGVTAPGEPAKVTLGSRFGNLTSAASILEALAAGEPPSPTLFSHSVLNAGCGVANQVRKDRSSHTAVAAGCRTLHGALTEAWLQTGRNSNAAHIVVLADAPFPAAYEALKTEWQGDLCLGMRVERHNDARATDVQRLGAEGYRGLHSALVAGQRTLTLTSGEWAISR